MSHKAVNWVINEIEFPKEVKPPARWLLIQIADRADRHTWDCYPSHKTMAEDSGMSKRTVLDLLFVLESAGLLRREPQFRADGNRTTDRIILQPGAIVAGVGGRNIPPDQPQHSTENVAKAAAHNLVTEPRNITSLVLQAREPFDIWWEIYPRKMAKVAARKAWKGIADKISIEELMELTRRFAGHVIGKDPEHIPHPATWLNGERWGDELIPQGGQASGNRIAAVANYAADRATARVQAMVEGARLAATSGRRRWTF